MKIKHVRGDIFRVNKKYALTHCIAADIGMGAGIALQFRKLYPEIVTQLESQKREYPSVVKTTTADGRQVYNLITKPISTRKPVRENMTAALELLKEQLVNDDIHYLAMPLIGAGLDRLSWAVTQKTIIDLFSDTDMRIVIVHFN